MINLPIKTLVPAIALCFALAAETAAEPRFYVAPYGNDQNHGTAESPWRTIRKAVSLARPGDTVEIAEGVYREAPLDFNRGGQPDAPVTFEAAKGATVILTYPEEGPEMRDAEMHLEEYREKWAGERVVVYESVSKITASNIVLRGITFEGWKDKAEVKTLWAICSGMEIVNRPRNIVIERCVFRNNAHCGLKLYGAPGPSDIVITDSLFEDNGHTRYDHAIYADRADRLTLRRNVFNRNYGWGIKMAHGNPKDAVIEDNYVIENGAGILMECTDAVIRRNVFARNALRDLRSPLVGGLVLRGPNVSGNLLEENVFMVNGWDLVVDSMGRQGGFGKGNILRRNVFISSPEPAVNSWGIHGMSEEKIRTAFRGFDLSFEEVDNPEELHFLWVDNIFLTAED